MRFVPDFKLNIIAEEEFPQRIKEIEATLDKCRVSGTFKSFDKAKLFYEYFLCENSKASVVVVHGLSEFTKKYYEVAAYFLNQGYNVFLFDLRCHGLSQRLTEDIELIHVDAFKDYADDLEQFIDKIVIPAEEKPVYIYSHSMGGGISAMYLEKNSEKIKKAVLSSPMIEPYAGKTPVFLARFFMWVENTFMNPAAKWNFSSEFNPEHSFKNSSDSSEARFNHNLNMRINNANYRTTPLSIGWVYNSLTLKRKLLKHRAIKNIKTPILLISAGKDTVVKNSAQKKFAKKCKTCRMETVLDSKHSMLTGDNNTLTQHLKLVLDFFSL